MVADEPDGVLRQARLIASWGTNVYVKIPVTDTRGSSTGAVVRELSDSGVRLNVTALMTVPQVATVSAALAGALLRAHASSRATACAAARTTLPEGAATNMATRCLAAATARLASRTAARATNVRRGASERA